MITGAKYDFINDFDKMFKMWIGRATLVGTEFIGLHSTQLIEDLNSINNKVNELISKNLMKRLECFVDIVIDFCMKFEHALCMNSLPPHMMKDSKYHSELKRRYRQIFRFEKKEVEWYESRRDEIIKYEGHTNKCESEEVSIITKFVISILNNVSFYYWSNEMFGSCMKWLVTSISICTNISSSHHQLLVLYTNLSSVCMKMKNTVMILYSIHSILHIIYDSIQEHDHNIDIHSIIYDTSSYVISTVCSVTDGVLSSAKWYGLLAMYRVLVHLKNDDVEEVLRVVEMCVQHDIKYVDKYDREYVENEYKVLKELFLKMNKEGKKGEDGQDDEGKKGEDSIDMMISMKRSIKLELGVSHRKGLSHHHKLSDSLQDRSILKSSNRFQIENDNTRLNHNNKKDDMKGSNSNNGNKQVSINKYNSKYGTHTITIE